MTVGPSRFDFRLLTRDDFGLLAIWLSRPHVHRWWNHESTPDAVERDFGPAVDGLEPGEVHIVLLGERPIGLIQWYRFDDHPEYAAELAPIVEVPSGAVSIDYFVGEPDLVGRGVGRAMIGAFIDRIWRVEPAATSVIVPVSSANEASWRALLGAGFHLAGRGELEPDNPIDDRRHEVLRLDRPADGPA